MRQTMNLVPVRTAGELCDRNHLDETVTPMFSNALRRFQLNRSNTRMILTHGSDIEAVSDVHVRAVGLLLIGDVGDPLDLTAPVVHLLQDSKQPAAHTRIPCAQLDGPGMQFKKGKMTTRQAQEIYRVFSTKFLIDDDSQTQLFISRSGYENNDQSVLEALNDTLVVIHAHTRHDEAGRFTDQTPPPVLHDKNSITAYTVYFVLKKLHGALPPSAARPPRSANAYFAWAPVNTLQLRTTDYLISNHPEFFSDYVAKLLRHGKISHLLVDSSKIPYVEKDQQRTLARLEQSGAIREHPSRQPMLHAVGPLAVAYMNGEKPASLEDIVISGQDDIFVLATAFKIQISEELHYAANAHLHSLTFGTHLDDYPSAHCRDHQLMAALADSHFAICPLPTHTAK